MDELTIRKLLTITKVPHNGYGMPVMIKIYASSYAYHILNSPQIFGYRTEDELCDIMIGYAEEGMKMPDYEPAIQTLNHDKINKFLDREIKDMTIVPNSFSYVAIQDDPTKPIIEEKVRSFDEPFDVGEFPVTEWRIVID